MPLLTQDRQLLAAFRRGDREALARVYEHYATILGDHLRRGFVVQTPEGPRAFAGLESASDRLDAVQETFLRAFAEDARLAYDGLRPYRSYLLRIGRNVAIDLFRRRRRIDFVPGDVLDTADDEGDVPPSLLEKEAAELLATFVERLDEAARRVWRARFEESLPQEDAARTLGLTRIQVRRIEGRLKLDLLAFLRAQGYMTHYRAGGFGPVLARLRRSPTGGTER